MILKGCRLGFFVIVHSLVMFMRSFLRNLVGKEGVYE